MAVHALELEGFSVEQDHAVFDFDLSDADLFFDDLPRAGNGKIVKHGIFRIPKPNVFDFHRNVFSLGAGEHFSAERKHKRAAFVCRNAYVARVLFVIGGDLEVLHVPFGTVGDVNVAENSRKAHFVLIFEIACLPPFENDDFYFVIVFEKFRNIEFRRQMADGAVSHKFFVDKQIIAAVHPFQRDIISARIGISLITADIQPAGTVFQNLRRTVRERITRIRIVVLIETEQLPAGRNIDLSLRFRFEIALFQAFEISELPLFQVSFFAVFHLVISVCRLAIDGNRQAFV